jgi:hypothetical protein
MARAFSPQQQHWMKLEVGYKEQMTGKSKQTKNKQKKFKVIHLLFCCSVAMIRQRNEFGSGGF